MLWLYHRYAEQKPIDEPTVEEAKDALVTARAARRFARSLLAEK